MRRVTPTGQPLIEPRHPLGPHELPSTLRYLNDHYFDFERALPYPRTDDPVAWRSWRGRLRRALRRTLALPQLGPVPLPQPLVLETIECDGYRRHKLAYETLPGNWARAYLLVPDDDDEPAAPRAAVLCPHGHVNGNSRAVADPEQAAVANVGVPYAHEFAVRGLVALAPEHAGMGERGGGPEHDPTKSPGACQALWVRLNHMGLDLTGLRVFDLMAALNLLAARPDVDSRRIGCAGLSGGCWLSQVLTAMDRRVRAVVLFGLLHHLRADRLAQPLHLPPPLRHRPPVRHAGHLRPDRPAAAVRGVRRCGRGLSVSTRLRHGSGGVHAARRARAPGTPPVRRGAHVPRRRVDTVDGAATESLRAVS